MIARPGPERPSPPIEQRAFAITDQEKKFLEPFADKITEKDVNEIKRVAQVIGGDLGLNVRLREPGSGSFFDTQKVEISLDVQQVAENLSQARMVAAHEGAHRRLTRGPETIGVKKDLINELYGKKVGFSYLANALEDPAVNNWVINKFEGLRPDFKNTYDTMLAKEGVPLGADHPDVQRAMAVTGRVPDFIWVGSELIRYWHTRRFSRDIKKLRPEVAHTLGKILQPARKVFETLPQYAFNEKEVKQQARERFRLNYEKIWPEIEKLAEHDQSQEAMRQMIQEQMQPSPDQNDFEQALEDLQKGQIGSPLDELDGKLRQELVDALKQSHKQSSEQLEQLAKSIEEQLKEATGEKADQLGREKTVTEQLQKELQDGRALPLDPDQLSQELKDALQELYDKFPQEQKDALERQATEQLKQAEDAFDQTLQSKLNPDAPPSHEEFVEQSKQETLQEKEREAREQKIQELRRQAKELSEQSKTDYDKVREEVDPQIEDLYQRLEDFFVRERHPRWRKGHASGPRLTLFKAMQFASGAKPEAYREMFERKTLPKHFDYKFSLVVDLSDSMNDEGEHKIEETRKGLIIISEVLNRLQIDHEILGYNSVIGNRAIKTFDQDLDETRKNIAGIINEPDSYGVVATTPTSGAVKESYDHLRAHAGRENYMVVLTDGYPYPEGMAPTQKLVGQILNESEVPVKVIGVGLGNGTEMVKDLFPSAVGNVPAAQLPDTLGTLLEDMIVNPEKYMASPETRQRFIG